MTETTNGEMKFETTHEAPGKGDIALILRADGETVQLYTPAAHPGGLVDVNDMPSENNMLIMMALAELFVEEGGIEDVLAERVMDLAGRMAMNQVAGSA